MHRPYFAIISLAFAGVALASCTFITDGAIEGRVRCPDQADGTVCGNELTDDIERVCVAGACVEKRCGDGFVDSANGEECDDGNEVALDGCAPVSCAFECDVDLDCDDGLACSGAETCDVATHACVPGTPVACTPSDACHTSACEEETVTCVETRIDDVDGDGHSSLALRPTCGDDCNDADPDIYPTHIEVCGDGKDNNCVAGTTDEATLTWYADCDGDDYALTGATNMTTCAMPATTGAVTGCGHDNGSWTNRVPNAQNTRDCSDASALAHPDDPNVSFDDVPYRTGTVPVVGGYDWNCDLAWDKGLTAHSISTSCKLPCSGLCFNYCASAWNLSYAPSCGAVNQPFREGACSGPLLCMTCASCTVTVRSQTCR